MNTKSFPFKYIGLFFLLLSIVLYVLNLQWPLWIYSCLGLLGIIFFGIQQYQNGKLKEYLIWNLIYVAIFAVLLYLQFR